MSKSKKTKPINLMLGIESGMKRSIIKAFKFICDCIKDKRRRMNSLVGYEKNKKESI